MAINYAVVLVAGTLVSTVLYHTIEMPMQQVGKRLIDRWEKVPVAA